VVKSQYTIHEAPEISPQLSTVAIRPLSQRFFRHTLFPQYSKVVVLERTIVRGLSGGGEDSTTEDRNASFPARARPGTMDGLRGSTISGWAPRNALR
jgi:hypothetical protein